jgi:hypothetical protein
MIRSLALLVLGGLLTASGVQAEDVPVPVGPAFPGPWRASLSYTVQRGDFGTDTTQTLGELDLGLRYRFASGAVQVNLPYVRLQSRDSTGQVVSTQGVGDASVGARIRLSDQQRGMPALSALGELKLPTADEANGLGTGEPDLTAGLGLDAFVTANAFWFSDLSYTLVGQPPGASLRDRWRLALGAGGYLPGGLVLTASLEQRTAAYDGATDARELLLGMAQGVTRGWQLALSKGLSDGAPDFGATAGLYATF